MPVVISFSSVSLSKRANVAQKKEWHGECNKRQIKMGKIETLDEW
jgi:hypothetical protein